MTEKPSEIKSSKTLAMHVRNVLAEMNRTRPFSFYLLIAMIVVLLLGVQIVHVRDNPRQFAFFLSLLFVFFFAVMVRAIVDFVEIVRSHFSEGERIFRSTLGEEEFIAELGRRVNEKREEG